MNMVSMEIKVTVIAVLIFVAIIIFRIVSKKRVSKAKFVINEICNGRSVIENLKYKLQTGSYYEKYYAINAMEKLKDCDSVDALIHLLGKTNISLKCHILQTLFVYEDTRILAPLLEYLVKDNVKLKQAATYSIEKLEFDFIIPVFNEFIHQTDDIYAVLTVVKSCGNISTKESEELFIKLLKDESRQIRMYAAEYTKSFSSIEFINIVVSVYSTEEKEIRKKLLNTLGRIETIDSFRALLKIKDIDTSDRDKIISFLKSASEVIEKEEVYYQIIVSIIENYKEKQEEDLLSIALSHSVSYTDEHLKDIILANINLYSRDMLILSIKALKQYKDENTTNELIKLLHHDSKNVVYEALVSLEKRKSPNLLRPLVNKLEDFNESILIEVIYLLGELKDKNAIEPLMKRIGGLTDRIQIEILKALTQIGGNYEITLIYPLLKSENNELRVKAADMIGKMKNNESFDYLFPFVNDKNDLFRISILKALISIQKPLVLNKVMVKKLKDKNDEIKKIAINYLVHNNVVKAQKGIINLIDYKNKSKENISDDSFRSSDDNVQSNVSLMAIWGAGKLEQEHKFNYIEPLLKSSNENTVIQSLRALTDIHNFNTLDLITPHLKNWCTNIRIEAVRVIGEFAPSPKAEQLLLDALNDWSVDFKCAIIEALVKFKDMPKTVEAIVKCTFDSDEYISTTAKKALNILKGDVLEEDMTNEISRKITELEDTKKLEMEDQQSENSEYESKLDTVATEDENNTINTTITAIVPKESSDGNVDSNVNIQILIIENEIMRKIEKLKQTLEEKLMDGSVPKDRNSNLSFYQLIKNAENHPKLTSILNFSAIHEVRYYRNKIAHRHSEEYMVNNISTLTRYIQIIEKETLKLLEVA